MSIAPLMSSVYQALACFAAVLEASWHALAPHWADTPHPYAAGIITNLATNEKKQKQTLTLVQKT